MKNEIRISAIICTHNRSDILHRTIDSLLNQDLDQSNYEVLIIDNASTDSTKELVLTRYSSHKHIRYVYEEAIGLSKARNTGWRSAFGEYVAFIDDDAIACANWLKDIVNSFEQFPEAGIVSGKVDPIWSTNPPEWLTKKLIEALSVIDWSDSPLFLEEWQWVPGVNVSYRKTLLEHFNGFDPNLGRVGKRLISNEENKLNASIRASGFKLYYSPMIYVQHFIPIERISKKWFYKRFFWQGFSNAVMNKALISDSDLTLKSILNQLIDLININTITLLFSRNVDEKTTRYMNLGYIAGLAKLKLNSKQ
jgi:glycosyltransferase involved in cell wall biosynthesis